MQQQIRGIDKSDKLFMIHIAELLRGPRRQTMKYKDTIKSSLDNGIHPRCQRRREQIPDADVVEEMVCGLGQ
jgi:hypothetical protein